MFFLNFKLFGYDICFRYKNVLQKEDKYNLKFLLEMQMRKLVRALELIVFFSRFLKYGWDWY
jgi:hypothetical protein